MMVHIEATDCEYGHAIVAASFYSRKFVSSPLGVPDMAFCNHSLYCVGESSHQPMALKSPVAAAAPTNLLPNPYRATENWGELPDGRIWGSSSAVAIDPDGSTVWVAERCGETRPPDRIPPGVPFACVGSALDPILKFDTNGKLLGSFGAGMLVFPHGIHVDREGNVWVADVLGYGGQGHQVLKFSPDGQLLLTLGTAGVPGCGENEFNSPSAVVTAPNGDIFVADGHGGDTNARIVKFDSSGKFVKQWGRKGTGPGEFDTPHAIAMDSTGRLFVGDRNNNRIQIFDQNGHFIDQWTQFSRPSGIYITNDVIYVADSESESATDAHNGWKRGIRIGSAIDGTVWALIPDPVEHSDITSGAEGVAADAAGNIYGAEVGQHRMMRYVELADCGCGDTGSRCA
ncbi:peptidyl-alpha-hydroxyglycine alpha-amidating lyase family protein [Mycobacterium riyadhense]|nr:peptidyl-alpha-hydroxyglycine alpha-amidating lyase family protein [Mycobacterium riyadhense]